jgi:hypothetical protein
MPIKIGLNAKLGIGIIVVFGLILAGYYVYGPLWYKWYEWKLCSSDKAEVLYAAAEVAKTKKSAIPYIRKWLETPSDRLVLGACLVLENMETGIGGDFLPWMEHLLSGPPSEITEAAIRVLEKYKFPFSDKGYLWVDDKGIPVSRIRNYLIHVLEHGESLDERNEAFFSLSTIWDKYSVKVLEKAMLREYYCYPRFSGMSQFCGRMDPNTLDFLVEYLEKKDGADSSFDGEMRGAGGLIWCIGFPPGKEYLIKRLLKLVKTKPHQGVIFALCGAKGNEEAAKVAVESIDNAIGVFDSDYFLRCIADTGTNSSIPYLMQVLEDNGDDADIACAKLVETGNPDVLDNVIRWNLNAGKECFTQIWETANGSEDEDIFYYIPGLMAEYGYFNFDDTRSFYILSCGPWDNAFINALLSKLDDENPDVRRIAMIYLAQIGDSRTVESLIKYYSKEKDLALKRKCACAVGTLFSPAVSTFFNSILETENDYVLNAIAVWALGELEEKPAIPKILKTREKFRNKGPVNSACLLSLGMMRDHGLTDFFIQCLENNEYPIQFCIKALSLCATPADTKAIDALDSVVGNYCNENYFDIRHSVYFYAIEAIRKIGGEYAVEKLYNRLVNTRNINYARGLAKMGDKRALRIIEEEIVKEINSNKITGWCKLLNYYCFSDVEKIFEKTEKIRNNTWQEHLFTLYKARENGGADLIKARAAVELRNILKLGEDEEETSLYWTEAIWGNSYLLYSRIYHNYFQPYEDAYKVFDELPDDFPRFDKNAFMSKLKQIRTWRKQLAWIEKNKHNLRFDAANRKYYLAPDGKSSGR